MNRSLSGSDVEEELIPLAQRLAAARGRDAGSGFAAPSSRSSDSSGRQSCQGQGSPDEDADVSIVRVELACDKGLKSSFTKHADHSISSDSQDDARQPRPAKVPRRHKKHVTLSRNTHSMFDSDSDEDVRLASCDLWDRESCTSPQRNSTRGKSSGLAGNFSTKEQRKRREKEKEEEDKQRKKNQKEEKLKFKELDAKKKRLLKEQQKELTKEECLKHMVVYIDRRIVNNPCGAAILDTLQRNEPPVKYSVENQSFAGVITFARETSQIVETRDKCLQVVKESREILEDEVLLWVPLSDFLQLVNNFVKAQSGIVLRRDEKTLRDFLLDARDRLQNRHVTLLVQGLEECFKAKYSSKKSKKAQQDTPAVTRREVEEVLADAQVHTGCVVLLSETSAEVANTVFHVAKAVAEKPAKTSRMHRVEEIGMFIDDKGGCRVDKDGSGLQQVWRNQIKQFHNVTDIVADAVVANFQSPWQLTEAYRSCQSELQSARLLEDIQVRRNHGPLETTRRVGKEFSGKLHVLFTCTDPSQVL